MYWREIMSRESNRGSMDGVMSKGYGTIPKLVMQHEDLSIEAKAIYAYLASYAGAGDTAYPSVSIMCKHLGISRDRFYRHRKSLLDNDFIRITQHQNEGGWSNNLYTVVSMPQPQNKDTQNKDTQNKDTINNSSINNSINNNSIIESPDSTNVKYDDDSPYLGLAKYLFTKVKENNSKAREPNFQNWADDIRKLVEIDGNTVEEVKEVIDWCQSDSFWKNNVMSANKLRSQFPKLWGQGGFENKGSIGIEDLWED
jgi:hypothetical protein